MEKLPLRALTIGFRRSRSYFTVAGYTVENFRWLHSYQEIFVSIEEINLGLMAIWEKRFSANDNVYVPMQYEKPKSGALVFVGLNPSFSSSGWKSLSRRSKTPDLDPHTYFKWPSPPRFDIEISYYLEILAKEHYPFFAPHRALADAMDIAWEHFDIFAYREKEQAKIRTLALSNVNEVRLTEFGEAQFRLFEELLLLSKPTAVIVVNALAAQIYLKKRSPEFNPRLGYHQDLFADGHQFPVFFSGMLTGARALDRFSKDRLFWHVAKALGKPWPFKPLQFIPTD